MYECCLCFKAVPSVRYICYDCVLGKDSTDTLVDKIIKVHGMRKLLETIIDKLGDANYEIKLKENIARALLDYNERYKEESENE